MIEFIDMRKYSLNIESEKAREASYNYLIEAGTVRRGVYQLSENATLLFEQAYVNISSLMKFKEDEIFFVSSSKGFDVVDGPFDKIDNKFLNISSLLHRPFTLDRAYLKGSTLGVPGLDVIAMKKSILENTDPKEFGGDMISSVDKYSFKYSELPYKFSAGTPDVASIIALGAAASEYFVNNNIDEVSERFSKSLEDRGIAYKYFKASNCFEIDNKFYYVPRKNPEEIFEAEL